MSAIEAQSGGKSTMDWHALYLAALFETDKRRLATRISSAERALLGRERELFTLANDTPEKTAVNNALHALRALRACLGLP